MTSQISKKIIKIQRLANISRSTANQAMKRGQLIGYNMKNIFLEKPYTKCGGETSSRPISKNLKLSMNLSLDQQSEHLYSFLLFCVKIEDYQNILKPLAFTSYEAFWKNKKRSRISLLASFSAWRLRGNISHVRFYQLTNFHCLIDFTFWDIGKYVYFDYSFASLWRLKFLSSRFPTWPKKSGQKFEYLKNEKKT